MTRISSAVFVGRGAEIAALRAALDRAKTGAPGTVLIAGEAGVGKTRLVAEFADAARLDGCRVLSGSCIELGQGGVPYGPVVEILRSLVRDLDSSTLHTVLGSGRTELARLLPDLDRSSSGTSRPADDSARARLFELLLGVLGRLAADHPTVLIIEDLHWADASTRDLFTFFARSVQREQLLLLGTYRTDELHRRHPLRPFIAELERSGRVDRLTIERFNPSEVRAQIGGILGREPDDALAARIAARAEGIAFFTEELVAAETVGQQGGVPSSLRDILSTRIDRLSENTQDVLRIVAVVGRSADERLLSEVAGVPERKLLAALREAVTHHVLVPEPSADRERYAFRHALVQETVYADLLPGERVRLHRRIAEALVTDQASASDPRVKSAQLSHHWHAAHRLPEALSSSFDAAIAAEGSYAFADALKLYERVLELWSEVPEAEELLAIDRATIAERAAMAAFHSGDYRRAGALVDAALSAFDAETDTGRGARLSAWLGMCLWCASGDTDALRDAMNRAMELAATARPSAAVAEAFLLSAHPPLADSRWAEGQALLLQALDHARRAAARAEEADALSMLGLAVAFLGDLDRGLAELAEASRIASELNDRPKLLETFASRATVLEAAGRYDEALVVAVDGIEFANRFGMALSAGRFLRGTAAEALRHLGRLSEARAMLDQLPPATGVPVAADASLRANLLAEIGSLEAAERHADEAWASVGRFDHTGFFGLYFSARAQIALSRGRPEHARTAADEGLTRVLASRDLRWIGNLAALGMRADAELAELGRLRRDDAATGDARQHAARLLKSLRRAVSEALAAGTIFAAEGSARLVLCEAEFQRVEADSDPRRWARAVDAWDRLGEPHPAAYARFRHAESLVGRKGSREGAADVLRTAAAAARELGADPLEAQIADLARRARIPLDDEPSAAKGASGDPDSSELDRYRLTAREREVLALLAAGKTDRQIGEALFISGKTASVHVSNIKGKLGVDSRFAAATVAAKLDRRMGT